MSTGKQRQQGRQLKKLKVRHPHSACPRVFIQDQCELNIAFILKVWSCREASSVQKNISFICVSVCNWGISKIDQPFRARLWLQSHKQPKIIHIHTVCTLNAHTHIFHFRSALRDPTLDRYSWHSVAERCWGNSRKASASPFVCLLISASFSRSGHKSGTFAFRQLLESLLGIWLETAESNGERGERRNPNKWTSETAGILGKDRESERRSQTRRACRIEGG